MGDKAGECIPIELRSKSSDSRAVSAGVTDEDADSFWNPKILSRPFKGFRRQRLRTRELQTSTLSSRYSCTLERSTQAEAGVIRLSWL
jgi:hypothetical protein